MKIDIENFYEDEVEATENDLKGMDETRHAVAGVAVSILFAILAFV